MTYNLHEWLMELERVTYGFWMTYNLLIWQRDKTSGIEWVTYGTWMSDLWNLNEWLMDFEWVTYETWMSDLWILNDL